MLMRASADFALLIAVYDISHRTYFAFDAARVYATTSAPFFFFFDATVCLLITMRAAILICFMPFFHCICRFFAATS